MILGFFYFIFNRRKGNLRISEKFADQNSLIFFNILRARLDEKIVFSNKAFPKIPIEAFKDSDCLNMEISVCQIISVNVFQGFDPC